MMTVTSGSSRRSRLRLTGTLAVCSALVALSSAAAGGQAASPAPRLRAVLTSYLTPVGNAPAVPPEDHLLGAAPTSTPLRLDVVLDSRNPAALSSFATAVSTPGNPLYRHFLPAGRFASLFGPTPAAVAAVTAELRAAGLTPGAITLDHLIIPVTATVGIVERALHVSLRLYRQPSGSSPATAVVNTDAPRLPAIVAKDVQGIIGLDTVTSPAPGPIAAHRHPRRAAVPTIATSGAPRACATARAEAKAFSGWTDTQLAQAYSFDGVFAKGDLGKGVTIALFEEQTYSKSDIAKFQSCYGTHVSLTNVSVDGGGKEADFSPEAALDIETVIGLAPEASLRVYETVGGEVGPTDAYDKIVTQDKAQVVSSSWSSAPFSCDVFVPESVVKAENTIFEEAAAQGQSVFVADGDVGSEGCMANGAPRELPTQANPDALAVDSGTQTLYVANYTNGSISVVSEHSLSVVTTISLGSGTDPEGLAVDPSTHQLWISEPGTGEPGTGVLAEVDGATCNSTDQSDCKPDSIDLSSDPVGLAVDPSTSTVYVTLPGADEIDVVDESTLAAVGAAAAYEEPAEVTVDASTNTVFYTSYEQGGVGTFSGAGCDAASVLDCPTSATGLLATGDGPVGIALDAATNSLYVANSGSDTVSVLPTSLSSVTATVDTSLDGPLSVALDPEGNGVLVAAEGSSTGAAGILVISTATNTVTRVITGIDTGIAVASDPVDGFAWVADEGLNTTTATGGVAWLPLFVSVEDPSGQPFVTGVGGTDLTKLGPAPAQSAWDEPLSAEGASTGGISAWWTMPKYQYGPGVVSSFSSGVPCGATAGTFCRELPDVSASADPRHGYVIVFGGKWSVVGGTSAAAPLWAALTALLDAYKGKVHRLGFLNPALYKLAAEGKPILNGVTAGDNDYTTTNEGLYPAAPRYNMATGLGTPIVTALAKALG